jgi:hypothetical protein
MDDLGYSVNLSPRCSPTGMCAGGAPSFVAFHGVWLIVGFCGWYCRSQEVVQDADGSKAPGSATGGYHRRAADPLSTFLTLTYDHHSSSFIIIHHHSFIIIIIITHTRHYTTRAHRTHRSRSRLMWLGRAQWGGGDRRRLWPVT